MNVVIVGATFGIGFEVAKKFLDHCDNLIIIGRTQAKLDSIKSELVSKNTKVLTLSMDVTNINQVKETMSRILNNVSSIDMFIYSSGHYEPHGSFDIDLDLFKKTFDVNFFGFINCLSIILGHMKNKKHGHIAVLSSLAGFGGLPNSSSYGPSKSAIMNYCESIKIDCDKHNIDLTVINPGFVRSRLTDKNEFSMPFLMDADKAAEIIYEGLIDKKYEITFPLPMKILFKILRILPRPIYFFIVKILTKNF